MKRPIYKRISSNEYPSLVEFEEAIENFWELDIPANSKVISVSMFVHLDIVYFVCIYFEIGGNAYSQINKDIP